jgi:hypothetical protein
MCVYINFNHNTIIKKNCKKKISVNPIYFILINFVILFFLPFLLVAKMSLSPSNKRRLDPDDSYECDERYKRYERIREEIEYNKELYILAWMYFLSVLCPPLGIKVQHSRFNNKDKYEKISCKRTMTSVTIEFVENGLCHVLEIPFQTPTISTSLLLSDASIIVERVYETEEFGFPVKIHEVIFIDGTVFRKKYISNNVRNSVYHSSNSSLFNTRKGKAIMLSEFPPRPNLPPVQEVIEYESNMRF